MKKIFPSQSEQNQELHKTDALSLVKNKQSVTSKGPLSIFHGDMELTTYQVIEKNKLQYLSCHNQLMEMHFMEQMGGLLSVDRKQELFQKYLDTFTEMKTCLQQIQELIQGINFYVKNFHQIHGLTQQQFKEIVYKDIKVAFYLKQTIEGLYVELVYGSSLRYLDTVLEALEIEREQAKIIEEIDIKSWSITCLSYLNKVQPKRSCCSFFSCIYK